MNPIPDIYMGSFLSHFKYFIIDLNSVLRFEFHHVSDSFRHPDLTQPLITRKIINPAFLTIKLFIIMFVAFIVDCLDIVRIFVTIPYSMITGIKI